MRVVACVGERNVRRQRRRSRARGVCRAAPGCVVVVGVGCRKRGWSRGCETTQAGGAAVVSARWGVRAVAGGEETARYSRAAIWSGTPFLLVSRCPVFARWETGGSKCTSGSEQRPLRRPPQPCSSANVSRPRPAVSALLHVQFPFSQHVQGFANLVPSSLPPPSHGCQPMRRDTLLCAHALTCIGVFATTEALPCNDRPWSSSRCQRPAWGKAPGVRANFSAYF